MATSKIYDAIAQITSASDLFGRPLVPLDGLTLALGSFGGRDNRRQYELRFKYNLTPMLMIQFLQNGISSPNSVNTQDGVSAQDRVGDQDLDFTQNCVKPQDGNNLSQTQTHYYLGDLFEYKTHGSTPHTPTRFMVTKQVSPPITTTQLWILVHKNDHRRRHQFPADFVEPLQPGFRLSRARITSPLDATEMKLTDVTSDGFSFSAILSLEAMGRASPLSLPPVLDPLKEQSFWELETILQFADESLSVARENDFLKARGFSRELYIGRKRAALEPDGEWKLQDHSLEASLAGLSCSTSNFELRRIRTLLCASSTLPCTLAIEDHQHNSSANFDLHWLTIHESLDADTATEPALGSPGAKGAGDEGLHYDEEQDIEDAEDNPGSKSSGSTSPSATSTDPVSIPTMLSAASSVDAEFNDHTIVNGDDAPQSHRKCRPMLGQNELLCGSETRRIDTPTLADTEHQEAVDHTSVDRDIQGIDQDRMITGIAVTLCPFDEAGNLEKDRLVVVPLATLSFRDLPLPLYVVKVVQGAPRSSYWLLVDPESTDNEVDSDTDETLLTSEERTKQQQQRQVEDIGDLQTNFSIAELEGFDQVIKDYDQKYQMNTLMKPTSVALRVIYKRGFVTKLAQRVSGQILPVQ